MEIHLLYGRPGSGKSRLCYARAAQRLLAGQSALLLVPEQITLQGEQLLLEVLGRPGFLGKPLMSPSALAREIFSRLNQKEPELLDPRGRAMAIKRLAGSMELPVLGRAAKDPRYAAELAEVLQELKRFDMTQADWKKAEGALSELLAGKLRDVMALAAAMEEFMAQRGLWDEGERFNALVDALPRVSWLSRTEILIDGFDQYPPQWIRLILALAKAAEKVTVTLPLGSAGDSDAKLYESGRYTRDVLRHAAGEEGISFTEEAVEPPLTGSLARLSCALYAYPLQKLPNEGNIHLISCASPEEELEAVAVRLQKLARSGARWRDMAVLTPDMAGDGPRIRRVFRRYDIPTFQDTRMPLNRHPLVGVLLSALAVIEKGGCTADWIALAKSPLLKLPSANVEQFEIYLNAYRLNGIRRFGKDFPYPLDMTDPEAVNAVRARLFEGISALPRRGSAADWAQAIREMVNRWELETALERHGALCLDRGQAEAAQEGQQALEQVRSLLEQLARILWEEELDAGELIRLLEVGFAATEVGILPTATDAVLVGDIGGRTKPARMKHVFIIGANEGMLPAPVGESAVFHHGDITAMQDAGLHFGHDYASTAAQSKLAVAETVAKARESLTLLYANARDQGGALLPSPLVTRIQAMLDLETEGAALWEARTPAALALRLAPAMERLRQGVYPGGPWKLVLDTLRAHPEGRLWVQRMTLTPDNAQVGAIRERSISVSRLEQYARCPLNWFIRYQLRPQEWPRMLAEVRETGDLAHEALRQLADKPDSWETEDRAEARMSEIFAALRNEKYADSLDDLPQARYALDRMEQSCRLAARALSRQVRKGSFAPLASEIALAPDASITLPDQTEIQLKGRVDRVDQSGGLLRVVDYKTGSTTMQPEKVLTGEQLQLWLYMDAFRQDGKNPQGAFYVPVQDHFPREEDEDPQAPQGIFAATAEMLIAQDSSLSPEEARSLALTESKMPTKEGRISPQGFDTLCRLARESAERLAYAMRQGIIPAYRDEDTCSRCESCHLCHDVPGERKRRPRKNDLKAILQGEDSHAVDN